MSKARGLADLGNVYNDGALSNRNVIVNGDCNVNQRNTTGTASGAYGPDRHKQIYGTSTTSIQQGSVSSGTDPYKLGFRNSALITNTSASSSTSHYAQCEYRFEGQDLNRMGWDFSSSDSYVTLSFWAKSSVAGTYSLFMDDNGQTNRISFSYTLAANTWKKVEISIQGDSSLNIPDDNGMRLRIVFIQSYGSSYLTSGYVNGQWAAASNSSYAPDQDHSWGNTASATWEMTGLQLENGDTATPFEHCSYSDELARCMRYYEQIEYSAYSAVAMGHAYNTTSLHGPFYYNEKRAIPTIAVNNGVMCYNNATAQSPTTLGFGSPTKRSVNINPNNGMTFTANAASFIIAGANGFSLKLDAEL